MIRRITLGCVKTPPFFRAGSTLDHFIVTPEKKSGSGTARAGVERQNGVTEDSRVLGERPNNIKYHTSTKKCCCCVSHIQRIGCQPEKNYFVLYTVANPARGLLNREKNNTR